MSILFSVSLLTVRHWALLLSPKIKITPLAFSSSSKQGSNEEPGHNENNNYLEQGTRYKT